MKQILVPAVGEYRCPSMRYMHGTSSVLLTLLLPDQVPDVILVGGGEVSGRREAMNSSQAVREMLREMKLRLPEGGETWASLLGDLSGRPPLHLGRNVGKGGRRKLIRDLLHQGGKLADTIRAVPSCNFFSFC